MDGVKPVEPMTDAISVFARSITDIQLVARTLGVMRHQLSPDLSRTNLSQCRFGFFKTDLFDSLGSESVKIVWEKAKGALKDSGAFVEDLDLGPEFDGWEGVGGKIGKIMDLQRMLVLLVTIPPIKIGCRKRSWTGRRMWFHGLRL
jgi:Asp-tRNA(Asn)/Glu-tRNA(Gln) amidotransferase A subunit family amidase